MSAELDAVRVRQGDTPGDGYAVVLSLHGDREARREWQTLPRYSKGDVAFLRRWQSDSDVIRAFTAIKHVFPERAIIVKPDPSWLLCPARAWLEGRRTRLERSGKEAA